MTSNRSEKAKAFAQLHVPGTPLVLYNIWDAGSARAVVQAGAPAVATGSLSVAAAHGYEDGEKLPIELLVTISERIAQSVDVPVTIDFEGAYASEPQAVADNVGRLVEAGVVGINFEDQIVGEKGKLHPLEAQQAKIAAIRAMADGRDLPFFINARTDLFLQEADRAKHASLLDQAIERARAFEAAGANGFFAPGLVEPSLIKRLCEAVKLPVNILVRDGGPSNRELADCGVARISYGPKPFRHMLRWLESAAVARVES